MSELIVNGGHKLRGELLVQGAKNSALPILTSTVLCSSPCLIHNCPDLTDVDASANILSYLGCKVKVENGDAFIDPTSATNFEIPDVLMHEMRSSIVFLGVMCAKLGRAKISFPGGCELGPRPIDMHLSALRQLGVKIDEDHGTLDCKTDGRLVGAHIVLAFPSVGATENILLAAATAIGVTEIVNAAREPEITDLVEFLNSCGADIAGAGNSVIVINGVKELHGCEYRVMPDRIVATTYMTAAAITGGELTLHDCNIENLKPVIPTFTEAGCVIKTYDNELYIKRSGTLKPCKYIRTMPYPGFPTDAQAPVMAMTTVADGTSIFIENIFESRYKHASELARFGAKIKVEGKVAIVDGVKKIFGASVEAADLRGGAALVVAALAADGKSTIKSLKHIDRGYDHIEEKFKSVGAEIVRVTD